MSQTTDHDYYARRMAVRDKLRDVLAKRILEQAASTETTVQTTGAMQASDKGFKECSEAEVPSKKRKQNSVRARLSDKGSKECSEAEVPIKERKQKSRSLKCSITSCDESFCKMKDVIKHLNEVHHQNLEAQCLIFSGDAEFDEWMRNIEKSALCNFQRRNIIGTSTSVHSYFYCSRSGNARIITAPRKRRFKVQGSSKINRTCPAHIIKHVARDGIISVDYYATHLCYTDIYEQLGHVRLSAADRAWIAGKLALQIPMDAILREIRNTHDGQLTRLHIVTKRDLVNIERDLRRNKPEIPQKDEAFFERLATVCRGKYTRKLGKLQKKHAASATMTFSSCEMVPGKEWLVRSESEETDYYEVKLANPECDCSIKCNDCEACIHRYSCTCRDNQMCKHIHCVGMLNVHMQPEKTDAVVIMQNSMDSDNGDNDRFEIDTTEEMHIRQECETAAHVLQLSLQMTELEERRKRSEEYLMEMSLILKSLTTVEEFDIFDSALCGIKPKLTVVRAKNATNSLLSKFNADKCGDSNEKKVKKQRKSLSTKRQAAVASSSALANPSNEKRKRIGVSENKLSQPYQWMSVLS